jgi:hypothetical protein
MKPVPDFASSLSPETIWHVNHNENDNRLRLKAGNLLMVYENGNLRYISICQNEVIRMIYSAVRDKEWLTIKQQISAEKFNILPDSFQIEYDCKYQSGEIFFLAHYIIEGKADNSLVFKLEGEAVESFEKNRIGFCVLHPSSLYAEKDCHIIHSNNEEEILKFPKHISPHQPFTDIRSMKWDFNDHICTLNFYGDIFETEDQRNWTDASYKTYSTPLSFPFPVKLNKGEKICQHIEFKVEGKFEDKKKDREKTTITIFPEKTFRIPFIGIGRSTRKITLTKEETRILKKVSFDHYRTDLYLFSNNWKDKADLSAMEAAKLVYPLEIALFFDDNFINQADEFIDWVRGKHPDIVLISLFHKSQPSTPDILTDTIAPLLKKVLPQVKIGCGTNANFAQLNRNRTKSGTNDYICYSIHPQEHAADNATLTENLQAQKDTVESAIEFANGKDIWVSPVNIQRRFNANIEYYENLISSNDFSSQSDSRIISLFGAGWTMGSLKYLIESGVEGLTYFETVGARGIYQGDFHSCWPDNFQSVSGIFFPVFFVFHYLLKNKTLKSIKSISSHPLITDSLILSDGINIKLLISNFSSSPIEVEINGRHGPLILRQLNSDTFIHAAGDHNWLDHSRTVTYERGEPLLLNPFSVSFAEGSLML